MAELIPEEKTEIVLEVLGILVLDMDRIIPRTITIV
jgi:hypothetical protein